MAADFRVIQQEFTGYVRDPENNLPPSGVKPERMAMYRELMFNNINGFLAGNFPVIRKIMDDGQWHKLVQDFFGAHKSETPYFAEIAEEFLSYLENERNNPGDFPFLLELAHYEWVEMALSISAEQSSINPEIPDNILTAEISLSPLAWLLAYRYPVHRIAPEYLPLEPPGQPTFLLAYRDISDQVKFIEINPMVYRLLEIIQGQESITVKESLERIVEETNYLDKNAVLKGGLETIKDLLEKSVITLI